MAEKPARRRILRITVQASKVRMELKADPKDVSEATYERIDKLCAEVMGLMTTSFVKEEV